MIENTIVTTPTVTAAGAVVTPHAETILPVQNETDMQALLKMAIDKDVDVGILERLVGLSERITERNARGAFFDALAAFQDECPEIKKTKQAKFVTRSGSTVKYNYASLEGITRAIRPVLKAHNFSYSWTVEAVGGVMNVICVLRHIEGHQERASFPVPIDNNSAASPAQKNGAALTYGSRQSLIAVLGLTTAEDDIDGVSPGAPDPEGEEFIDDAQLANLTDLIEEAKADKAKFLAFLGISKLTELRKAGYAGAVKALNEKKTEKRTR